MINKRSIFLGTSVHRWNDTRIFHKQATSLAKKYDVELHAPADFDYKEENGVRIYGLPEWKKVSDRKNIRRELWKRIKNSTAEIFHFHDPELLWLGIKTRVILKRIVIYDIHEDYEKAILSKIWIPRYFRFVISKLFYLYEQISISLIKNNISTSELIANKFKSTRINQEIIYNFPLLPSKNPNSHKKDDNLIIYVGIITKIRGFNEIVEALSLIKEQFSFRFMVIGPVHESYQKEINAKIKLLNLGDRIDFKGLMPYNDIFEYIEKAIVGLVCLLPEPNHLVTFPNKIFEYISRGTAVIASDFPLYRQVINKAKCGILVDPRNTKDIAKSIVYSLNNKEKMIEYGINGFNAVHKQFHWELEEIKLQKYYKKLFVA